MSLGTKVRGGLKRKLWIVGGIILISLAGQDAIAASSQAQCTASVEEYIFANSLSVSEQTKSRSIDKCVAGLVDAQNTLEISAREAISSCDQQLKNYVAANKLVSPSTLTWGQAMDRCAQGDLAQAQSLLSSSSVQQVKAPIPAPAPEATVPDVPAEQGGNIPGRVMDISAHRVPPQARTTTSTLVERRRGPASAGRTRCLPQMDGYIYSNGLVPAGSSFQRAVELCHVGRVDEAKALLTESDHIIKTKCTPAFKAYLEQNLDLSPTRMERRIALDLCANGKMNEAYAELNRQGAGRQEVRQALPSQTLGAGQEAHYAAGESKIRGGGITPGVRETELGGANSRAFCVGELNGYAKENVFFPSTVAFSRAVGMCQDGRLEAGKKEIRLSNAEVVATCEPKLFRLMKEFGLSPSKQWWSGAMNLCADGKEDEAVEMIKNSEKTGDRAPSAPGPKEDIKATEPLSPFQPMAAPGPQSDAAKPAALDRFQAVAPEPLVQSHGTAEVLIPPPLTANQTSPTALAVVKEESCAIKMDKFVLENDLTPSREGYMEGRRACEAGHEKVAQVALINSNARTMTLCEPILKGQLKKLGAGRVDPSKWQRALALCANGKTEQAKTALQ